jgi:hypothetical protein
VVPPTVRTMEPPATERLTPPEVKPVTRRAPHVMGQRGQLAATGTDQNLPAAATASAGLLIGGGILHRRGTCRRPMMPLPYAGPGRATVPLFPAGGEGRSTACCQPTAMSPTADGGGSMARLATGPVHHRTTPGAEPIHPFARTVTPKGAADANAAAATPVTCLTVERSTAAARS